MKDQIARILKPYKGNGEMVISVLQEVQACLGYLPEEVFSQISEALGVSESQIFGIATFYAQFRFNPPGEHNIKVCLGTACHVRGGARIMEEVQKKLGIKPGETTEDRKFDLERVACFGCCALAPVVVVDDKVYGQMTATKVKRLLAHL
jgi:NADH-quinone oxidoreductase subunit E